MSDANSPASQGARAPELPNDVWRLVAEQCYRDRDDATLRALNRVSRELHEVVFPVRWRRVIIMRGHDHSRAPDVVLAQVQDLTVTGDAGDEGLRATLRMPQLQTLRLPMLASLHGLTGDVLEALGRRSEALRQLVVEGHAGNRIDWTDHAPIHVHGLCTAVRCPANLRSLLSLVDPARLKRLKLRVVRLSRDRPPLSFPDEMGLPPLPSLQSLAIDALGRELAVTQAVLDSLDPASLLALRVLSSPDNQHDTDALLEYVAHRFTRLRTLVVFVGWGFELVPWLELDRCAATLSRLECLERLCLCARLAHWHKPR